VVAVSDVLRTYIEGKFAIHAPTQTTEEFLHAVGHRHDAVAERRQLLQDFLTRCDLVKFAALRPPPATAVSMLDVAATFVEETRDAEVEGPPGEGTADADGSGPAPGRAAASAGEGRA